ncbi:hypothetical protein ABR737_00985 [Streptomyces sp. Edi2]|uniref:hypothetical protein n=1 Tax=Streptomyces sp. Edi2 TaxID=3162528 RepID=UPI003305D7AC
MRALLAELGRPFTGGFFVVREIAGGTVTLIGMGLRWLFEDGVSSAGGRAFLVGIGIYIASQEIKEDSLFWGWGLCVGVVVWWAAAWLHSPHRQDRTGRPRHDGHEGSNDGAANDASSPAPEEVKGSSLETPREVTPEEAKKGLIEVIEYTAEKLDFRRTRKGVHLAEVLENLHERGSLLNWGVKDLRIYCEKVLKVEIKDVNRKEGEKQKNKPGIRYAALCELLDGPKAPSHSGKSPAHPVPDLTRVVPIPGGGTPALHGAPDPSGE